MATIDRRGLTVGDTTPAVGSSDPSANLAIKTPVRVATTVNITLNGLQSIDGVTVAALDRVLVKDQSSAVENGIYLASSGNWTRTTDFDSIREVVKGTLVYINEGALNGAKSSYVTTSDPITPDTTTLTFSTPAAPVPAPSVTVDNTVPRFDGTGGALQTTGVSIDDDDRMAGVRSLSIKDSGGSTVLTIKDDVLSQGIPGIEGQNFFQYRADTSGPNTDVAVFRVQRSASYSGGDPANSYPTIWALTTVGASVADNHYSSLSALQNSSTVGENVAHYMQALKLGIGATWAAVSEARDTTGTANPTKGLCAHEFDAFANGGDLNLQRVGVSIVGGKGDPSGTKPDIGYGILISPQNGDDTNANFLNGITLKGTYGTAIDLSTATSATSAIHLADSFPIHFDTAKTRKLAYAATTLKYTVSGTDVHVFADGGDFVAAGRVHGVAGLRVSGSSSGTTNIDASAAASGTLTLPAATDTLVGRATTDTLTNKTFDTAGAGNSLSINGVAATANTGTGAIARAAGPVFTTPALGVATATSVNKVAITAPASSATLTIPDGVTLTGPAASGTAMTLGNTETVTGVKTFGSAGSVGRLKIAGTTSGSTVLDATAVAGGTLTIPAATDTLVGKATTDTFTNKTFDTAGTGNSFSINGVSVTANTGTGAVARAASPTFTGTVGTSAITATGLVTGAQFVPTSSGAPTNGLFLSAANTLGLAVNSTQKVWVTTDGVGIGAATVGTVPFQITDASSAQLRLITTGGANVDFRFLASDGGVGAGTAIFGTYSNNPFAIFVNASEVSRFTTSGFNISSGKVLQVNSIQVVSARDTGWAAMTGTPDKATAYATSTVTLPQLAGRVMALQAALTTHGLLGT